jgi:two-component system, OmpR family, sensor kinase
MIASGLLMDRMWNQLSHNTDINDLQFFLVTSSSLSKQYQNNPQRFEVDTRQYLSRLSNISQGKWLLKHKSAVQLPPQQTNELNSGQIVNLFDDQDQLQRLSNIQHSPYYLSWAAENKYNINQMENALLVLFYALIALGLFLALRPMMRETQYFQSEVRQFGQKNWSKRIQLKPSSPFFEISSSFNEMAERIQQLITTQQELTHAIAHELRTPLARMKFALELVELEAVTPSQEISKQFTNIQDDIDELESLVNEMLDYAAFDSSAYNLNIEQRDIKEFASSLVEKLQPGILTPIELLTVNSCTLEYDWHLLERAIQNLIINAAKYTSSQIRVTITMTTDASLPSKPINKAVQIDVEDDGSGIAPENRRKVFESFVQIKQQGTADKQGFGLGLSITKRIIELHRGTIEVGESELGGALFRILIPTSL